MKINNTLLINEIIKNIKNTNFIDYSKITKINQNKLFYVAEQADKKLKIVLPFVFKRNDLLDLNSNGIEGATGIIIEEIKKQMKKGKFSMLSGNLGRRYEGLYEPITIVNSNLNIGADLWRADKYNYIEKNKIYLSLRMIVNNDNKTNINNNYNLKTIGNKIDNLLVELNEFINKIPYNIIENETINIINQKTLRNNLDKLGLVCFIGDYSKPARKYTRIRRHHRIAGPKEGVNIEFKTPVELNPIEVELYNGNIITGLGIKRKEVFIISGRNAQGKSTLLESIESGQDDHLIGDGREYIITTKNLSKATTGSMNMNGENISLFFQKLPEGINGTPTNVKGRASGSMTMAYQIQKAMSLKKDLILIDEDNSAVNLLVSGLLSNWFEGVKPLCELIIENRNKINCSFIIVTSSLDLLTATGDRAIYLENHKAKYLDLNYFKEELKKYYLKLSNEL